MIEGTGQVAHLVPGVYLGAQGIITPCDLFGNAGQLAQRFQRFPQDQRQQNAAQQQAPQQGKLRHADQIVDMPIGFVDVRRAVNGNGRLQNGHVLRRDQQMRPACFHDAAGGNDFLRHRQDVQRIVHRRIIKIPPVHHQRPGAIPGLQQVGIGGEGVLDQRLPRDAVRIVGCGRCAIQGGQVIAEYRRVPLSVLDRLLDQPIRFLRHEEIQAQADRQQDHRQGDEGLLEPELHGCISNLYPILYTVASSLFKSSFRRRAATCTSTVRVSPIYSSPHT